MTRCAVPVSEKEVIPMNCPKCGNELSPGLDGAGKDLLPGMGARALALSPSSQE